MNVGVCLRVSTVLRRYGLAVVSPIVISRLIASDLFGTPSCLALHASMALISLGDIIAVTRSLLFSSFISLCYLTQSPNATGAKVLAFFDKVYNVYCICKRCRLGGCRRSTKDLRLSC